MSEYIITRVDGTDARRIGRRCSFISEPRRGRAVLAQCFGGGDGYTGTMRLPHVQSVAAVPGGIDITTEHSIYQFRYADGQISFELSERGQDGR